MLEQVKLFRHKGFDRVYQAAYEKDQLRDFDKDDKLFLLFFQKTDNVMREAIECIVVNLEDLEFLLYQYHNYELAMYSRSNLDKNYAIQLWAGGLATDLLEAIDKYQAVDEYGKFINNNYCEVLESCNFECLVFNGRGVD